LYSFPSRASSLYDFLNVYQVEQGAPMNRLSMRGGRYYVPPEQETWFRKAYVDAMRKGKEHFLVDKINDDDPYQAFCDVDGDPDVERLILDVSPGGIPQFAEELIRKLLGERQPGNDFAIYKNPNPNKPWKMHVGTSVAFRFFVLC
jgi:hypothetical protein